MVMLGEQLNVKILSNNETQSHTFKVHPQKVQRNRIIPSELYANWVNVKMIHARLMLCTNYMHPSYMHMYAQCVYSVCGIWNLCNVHSTVLQYMYMSSASKPSMHSVGL